MRYARLAVLTVTAIVMVAACSGSSTSTPSAAASVVPSTAPSVVPSTAPSVAASTVPSSSSAPSLAPSAATGSAVSIANFSFQPKAFTVAVGTEVTWTNTDSARHTVTADDGSFKSAALATGATFSQTFATAGTFAYHCSIHPSMTGTVTVK